MAEFTDDLEDKIINHFFRNTSQTSPAAVYLALFTTATDDTGAGTEVTGGGYGRVAITFGAPSPAGVSSNTNTVSFTASGANFGEITHVAVYDAATVGNMMMHTAITSATVNDGDSISFDPGDITITVT